MITRDNYEEFFLLYADNELPAADRHAVERFVADHPDLREEWVALLQCKLSPDTHLSFPDRNSLFKPEAEGSPYTGDLLSYIDGELDVMEKDRIETVLREQPLVARELATLRQTISHPDLAIVFPEKDGLCKKEKERRIVALPWLRIGIAAAMLIALALLWLLPAKQRPIAPAQSIAKSITPNNIAPTVTSTPATALHLVERQPVTKKERPVRKTDRQRSTQQQDVAVNNKPEATQAAKPDMIDPVKVTPETHTVTDVSVGSVPATGDLAANVHLAVQTGIPKEQSSFATQALQEEANDQRTNSFISDEPAAAGRTKLRGILRKVTRAFGKTADRDNDGNRQVLVGAFQVSIN
jgi:cytoskeletal protein RodZ